MKKKKKCVLEQLSEGFPLDWQVEDPSCIPKPILVTEYQNIPQVPETKPRLYN